jgi:hypothetical protein
VRKIILFSALLALFCGKAYAEENPYLWRAGISPVGGISIFDNSKAYNIGGKISLTSTKFRNIELGGTVLYERLYWDDNEPESSDGSVQIGLYAVYKFFPKALFFPNLHLSVMKNLGDNYNPVQYRAGINMALFKTEKWALEANFGYQYRGRFDYDIPGVGPRDIGSSGGFYLGLGIH